MQKTSIHWTDYSTNPVRAVNRETGKRGWACTRVSPGCDHCYSATLNRRWGTGLDYADDAAVVWQLDESELRAILQSRATNARVFLADMTDLFHVAVRREWLDQIFGVMALRADLTFQVLTKRPNRMANYVNHPATPERISVTLKECAPALPGFDLSSALARLAHWPLRNVWLGTSVERQSETHRITALLDCRAAVRFVSCEPLLGPLSLARWLWRDDFVMTTGGVAFPVRRPRGALHWVIVGGESGPGYRPMDPDWARLLRDECAEAGVPFFYKQGAGPRPGMHRELDGRVWEEFPAVAGVGAYG